MTPIEFDFLAKLLKERSGLVLTPDKAYLIENRLLPVARKRDLPDISQLIRKLMAQDVALTKDVVEAMTTNESFFFRDTTPFDLFRDQVLPAVMQRRAQQRSLRIWCAAASTGQEPYSLAMILKEMGPKLAGWRVEILGTDIATDILKRAKDGVYNQFEVQRGLPIGLLVKYFKKTGETWQIDDSIRSMVQYQMFNLLNDPRPLGNFDIVFCRNVLIYFDPPTKTKVLDGISRQLAQDGYLFLGGSETVLGLSKNFQPVPNMRGVYGQSAETLTAKPIGR
jgi:chemotaxis protein methyltransferase CheR